MHELLIVVGWPDGIIVGNLLASVVWSSVFEWRLRIHHRKIREHVNAVVVQRPENQADDGKGIRQEERRPGVLRQRELRENQGTAVREEKIMNTTGIKAGFWVTIGVLGALLLVAFVLGLIGK